MRLRHALLPALFLAAPAGPAAPVPPAVPLAAEPFPLGDVVLLDSPFRQAMERNAAYLLSLDPDRLLHNTRLYAGLPPKGELYGGWESLGIAGHTLGHYLTALSQQYAAMGDARFRARIDYLVAEMATCQDAYGDGYIGALKPLELQTLRNFRFGIVEAGGAHFFKGGAWVPWYTEHKVLQGLVDAWALGGSARARTVALRLADWVDAVTAPLSYAQLQDMLAVEHGGMMDTLAQVYALTGDRRYLAASHRFYHQVIMDALRDNLDNLVGLHANTQIPKVIGEARSYELTGDTAARDIAVNFWDMVVHKYSYVIGGNSLDEHFFPPDQMAQRLQANTAETCNTYNMLKLTEHVFGWQPRVEYADFYERALYNDILASQEPRRGMFTYFMSLEPGLFKTYSTPTESFWCCVGSGMENHSKYGEAIFFHGADDVYVNLFIPAVLTWPAKGLVLEQRTDYPVRGRSILKVKSAPTGPVTLRVRCPAWADGPLTFTVNGEAAAARGTPGTYAELRRDWKAGDRVEVTIPMAVRTEAMAGDPRKVAFLYGPVVLAADLGPAPDGPSVPYSIDQRTNVDAAPVPVPFLVKGDGPLAAGVVRLPGRRLEFRTERLGRPADVRLLPFWEISYDRYTVYWDVITDAEWMYRSALRKPGS